MHFQSYHSQPRCPHSAQYVRFYKKPKFKHGAIISQTTRVTLRTTAVSLPFTEALRIKKKKKIHDVTKGSETFSNISLLVGSRGLGEEFSRTFIFSPKCCQLSQNPSRLFLFNNLQWAVKHEFHVKIQLKLCKFFFFFRKWMFLVRLRYYNTGINNVYRIRRNIYKFTCNTFKFVTVCINPKSPELQKVVFKKVYRGFYVWSNSVPLFFLSMKNKGTSSLL